MMWLRHALDHRVPFRRAARSYQCYVHIVDAQYICGMTHTRWCATTNESCIQFEKKSVCLSGCVTHRTVASHCVALSDVCSAMFL